MFQRLGKRTMIRKGGCKKTAGQITRTMRLGCEPKPRCLDAPCLRVGERDHRNIRGIDIAMLCAGDHHGRAWPHARQEPPAGGHNVASRRTPQCTTLELAQEFEFKKIRNFLV